MQAHFITRKGRQERYPGGLFFIKLDELVAAGTFTCQMKLLRNQKVMPTCTCTLRCFQDASTSLLSKREKAIT